MTKKAEVESVDSRGLIELFQAWVNVDQIGRAGSAIKILSDNSAVVTSPERVVHRARNLRDAEDWFRAVEKIERPDDKPVLSES